MADTDDFGSAPSADFDPAAEFLAREQNELAGLDDDNFGISQENSNTGLGDFESVPQDAAANEDQNATGNGLGDFEVIGGDAPPAENSFGESGLVNGDLNEALDSSSTNGPSNMYEAISQQDTFRAEPEKIKLWREEKKAMLEKKDEEEAKRKNELRDIAKKELDDWYRHYTEQLEKTKENNRAAESAFVKDRDETIPGQSWEKITRLCEFNPKNSKTTKDVGRLRSILLQLKQTPLVR